jgi:hypothetical protein
MAVTRVKREEIADAWADDFGGVSVAVRGVQAQLEIDEARVLRADLDEAIDAAERWRSGKAARAAETKV